MRIAQIVASLESRHGGPSRSVRGLATGLARAGHAVGLLSTGPDGDGTARIDGSLTTRIFPRRWPQAFSPSAPLRDHLLSCDYDIVHNHGLWLRPLHYARLASAKRSAPLIISPRGMMSPWAWNHHRGKKRLASWGVHPGALAAADGWHATCEAEADDIRRLGFTRPVCVAPNGVVSPSAAEETAEARHWHSLLPALAGRRVALFYSRLHSKKRVLELIDLWLSKPRGDWVLLLAGIPEEYTVNQLDAYVTGRKGGGRILIQDGAGHPPPYAAADLFLLPSHSENFGLVVVEALVRGVPALVTDTTPWGALADNNAGQCVSWIKYGPALDALLAVSPDALRASGECARLWAREAFSWEKSAEILAGFYERLASAR